ncbi:mRNA-capping enzyme-like protein isoform X2, partial [Tanacetum coccineum]
SAYFGEKWHTRPGSLKVLVYEGVKTTPSSSKSVTKIGELLAADIVLTTYDVLKEDLFHDTDRHEGDRHLMRNVNIRLSIFFQHPFSSRWKILENEVIKPRNRERDTLLKSRNPYYRYDLELFRKERLLSTSAVSKLLKEFIPRLSHASDGLIFQSENVCGKSVGNDCGKSVVKERDICGIWLLKIVGNPWEIVNATWENLWENI